VDVLDRVEAHIRANALLESGGEVACLVSGGADSTCLWHALRALGYRSRAVHVHHGLRGDDADGDAEHCARVLPNQFGQGLGLVRAHRNEKAPATANER